MVMQISQFNTLDADTAIPTRASRGGGERILYVVSSFPCWSETFIVREIHALLRRGADVRIVPLRPGAEAFVQSDAKLLMDRVMCPRPWHRNARALLGSLFTRPAATLSMPLLIMRRLWREPLVMAKSLVAWFRALGLIDDIAAFAPHHIHAHWATYASTAAMTISRRVKRPFSFTAHAHDIYIDDQLMREKLAEAAFVAVISNFNREYIRRRHPQATARIEIVHCGVPARHRALAVPDVRGGRVLSVGRLDEIKGFPTLLDACRLLKMQGVRFHCEIIGDGPKRAELKAQIRALGIEDCVAMLGAQPSQEVERKLAAASVFVLASQRSREGNMDGIPVALMEAMASGTPVVSTDVSGIPELVENERTGLLVPSRDPDALARAIRRMLEDEVLRTRCVEGAARKVRHEFDADTEGGRLLRIIRSLPGEIDAKKIADHH